MVYEYNGCILSSLINSLLSTQGQISAVGSIVSSMYGFIAGAYMPMSQFGTGLRGALLFLPTTYGAALMRNSVMTGTFRKSGKIIPNDVINSLKESIDIRLIFNNNVVSIPTMYFIVIMTIIVLFVIYILKYILCKNK